MSVSPPFTLQAYQGASSPPLPATLAQSLAVSFSQLPGWADQDHGALLAVFRRSCNAPNPLRTGVERPPHFAEACAAATNLPNDAVSARHFFESYFAAWKVLPLQGDGFFTGYFEPEFPGSLVRTETYPTPLYARPDDLVTRLPGDHWLQVDPVFSAAQKTPDGLKPYPERAAIENGALDGKGLEIMWLRDPVDRFVMQVQGSARIRLEDGTVKRLSYSGRNGHPYTSLGRILVEEQAIPAAQMTMDKLVARLKSDPVEARVLIQRNRSFVFFRVADELAAELGPIGGEGVPLTPLLSVAADRSIWPYGTPVVISGHLPLIEGGTEPMARAAIIQDTGSAILGPARVDLFFGSGPVAGHRAGLVRHPMTFFVLWPKGIKADAPPQRP